MAERPIFKPLGSPVEQLDTPALVVDLTLLEHNIETVHSFFRKGNAKLRPHVEAHRCPAIAHKQLAAGGTVGGICVTTVGQAEVFSSGGFTDIFVANVVVTPEKTGRLCAVARHATVTVAVDSLGNVQELSKAASMRGLTLDVVVCVNAGSSGWGVEPGQAALDLARVIGAEDGLVFAGLMASEGPVLGHDTEEFAAQSGSQIQRVLDTREMLERAGLEVRVVSVGGTHNYEMVGAMDGVTEVPAGSYALMDERHRQTVARLRPAARVMATVTTVPEVGLIITDAGQKAIGADLGLPVVDSIPGAEVRSLSAEHGSLRVDTPLDVQVGSGDRVWFIPWDIGTCVNLHDYIHGVRDGELEVVWDIPARGRYR